MHTATRSLLALTLSNGLGQVVGIVGGIALALLFTPADFGRYSLFANVLGIVTLIGALRCDQYLLLGELSGPAEVRRELALGATAAAVTGLGLCALAGLLALAVRWRPEWAGTAAVLAPIPLAALLACLGNLALASLLRAERLARVAVASNGRVLATLALQLALLPLLGGWALIAGATLGIAVALALAAPGSGLGEAMRPGSSAPRRRLSDLGGHLRLSGQVLLSESSAMIVGAIVLAAYGAAVAGVYYLAFRVLQVPLNLTYAPLRQALVVALRGDQGAAGDGALAWLARLPRGVRAGFLIVLLGYLAVIALGPWAGRLLAGSAWAEAGVYARWIAVYLFSSIATIPAHAVLMRLDRTGVILAFSAASLVLRVLAVLLGATISAEAMIAGFGLASAVVGAAFLAVALRLHHHQRSPGAGA